MLEPEISKALEDLQTNIEIYFQEKGLELEKVYIRQLSDISDHDKAEVILKFVGSDTLFRSYHLLEKLLLNHGYLTLQWTSTEKNIHQQKLGTINVNMPPCSGSCMFYNKTGTITELYNHYFKSNIDK